MLLQLSVGAAQWDTKSSCPEIQLRWKISYFGGISQTTGASPPDARLDNCICTQFLRPRGPELSRQGRTPPFPHVHYWSGTKGTGRAHALGGWMDVWVDGCTDGWMERRVGGWVEACLLGEDPCGTLSSRWSLCFSTDPLVCYRGQMPASL